VRFAAGAKQKLGRIMDEPEARPGRLSVSPVRGWCEQVTIDGATRDAKLLE